MGVKTFYENEIVILRILETIDGNKLWHNPCILFVLEGKYVVKQSHGESVLHGNDFLLINSEEAVYISTSSRGLFGILELKYNLVNKYLDLHSNCLECSSFHKIGGQTEKIRNLIQRVVNLSMHRDAGDQALFLSVCYQLIYYLHEYCLIRKEENDTAQDVEDALQQMRIQEYIQENYNQPITLQKLSEETNFSISYLSKYIKKKFGQNLTSLLNEVRLDHAVEDLKYTDDTLIKIAMEHGFSNIAAFNKAFREKYGTTPSDYRKRWKNETDTAVTPDAGDDHDLTERVQSYLAGYGYVGSEGDYHYVSNLADVRAYKKFWNRMINAGAAKILLRADMQEHLQIIHHELGIRYVRFWDIYAPEMMLYDGNPQKNYNFYKLDSVIDFLHANGLYPYIDFGFKPSLLMGKLDEYMICREREIIFDSPDDMENFFEEFFRHYISRYGIEEVSQWYIELWRDPRYMDFEDYMRHFEKLYIVAKKFSSDIKIGGAGFGEESKQDFGEMLRTWHSQYCYPDFISFYVYPYYSSWNTIVQQFGEHKENFLGIESVSRDADYSGKFVDWAVGSLQGHDFWNQEVHISEWNSSIENRNGLNDSIFKGSYIIKNLIDMVDKVDVAGYWFASDLFTEYYDTGALLNGSCGLLSKDAIRKPSFYAFEFMNRLDNYLLEKNEFSMITTNLHDSYTIVCHNYCPPNYLYYDRSDYTVDVRDANLYYTKEERKLHFRIQNVRNGKYQVKTHLVDENYGNVLEEWRTMDFSQNLDRQDLQYLRLICVPRITIYETEVTDNALELVIELSANSFASISVTSVIEERLTQGR